MLCVGLGYSLRSLLFRLSLAPFCVDWVNGALFANTPTLDSTFGCVVINFTTRRDDIIRCLCEVPLIIADTLLVIITWRILDGGLKKLGLPFCKRNSTGFSNVPLENEHTIRPELITSHPHGKLNICGRRERRNDLTAILVYRFILDLQEANEHTVKVGSDDPELQMSQMSSQSFLNFVDRAIGSLASTIHPGAARADDEWDERIPEEDPHSGEVARRPTALDDLVDSEIQEVPRDERIERTV
ncbi:hypothetical protein C8Q80DRAFT_1320151 [Daedaleopsis nitida]|nr:hypothetical protein C8Q80DRAFT_1320151 [Daedaleopsis nitida]